MGIFGPSRSWSVPYSVLNGLSFVLSAKQRSRFLALIKPLRVRTTVEGEFAWQLSPLAGRFFFGASWNQIWPNPTPEGAASGVVLVLDFDLRVSPIRRAAGSRRDSDLCYRRSRPGRGCLCDR